MDLSWSYARPLTPSRCPPGELASGSTVALSAYLIHPARDMSFRNRDRNRTVADSLALFLGHRVSGTVAILCGQR
jgi:hypothetical protein